MIDEPYRWVEAIANRREYIEHELAGGSPTMALSCAEGVLLFTFGKERKKIFEIYDRIAMGGIGHPGDLERLRMLAIELASTEGFTRSAADVSLRRMVNYSFSPTLKQAFEQIYGAPYLARLLFVELGDDPDLDLFVRLDYDGAMHGNAMAPGKFRDHFGVISGTRRSTEAIEAYLRGTKVGGQEEALTTVIRAWAIGLFMADEEHREVPEEAVLHEFLRERLPEYTVEAALLERRSRMRIAFVELDEKKLAKSLDPFRT
jgi:proteasome alpha subunit